MGAGDHGVSICQVQQPLTDLLAGRWHSKLTLAGGCLFCHIGMCGPGAPAATAVAAQLEVQLWRRWKGENGPKQTDLISFRNLLGAAPADTKRIVFTSSAGVERQGSFPFFILNAFGASTLLWLLCSSGALNHARMPWLQTGLFAKSRANFSIDVSSQI